MVAAPLEHMAGALMRVMRVQRNYDIPLEPELRAGGLASDKCFMIAFMGIRDVTIARAEGIIGMGDEARLRAMQGAAINGRPACCVSQGPLDTLTGIPISFLVKPIQLHRLRFDETYSRIGR
ncbi:MAG: hypothetical protein HHJ12_16995 [Glaciimonas sp.]|nr:hypothetical protein [Glaciimonas sp.]